MTHGALWTVAQPRNAAPARFPEFLECLALMRIVPKGRRRFYFRHF